MPTSIPVPARSPGDLLTSALWNAQVKDNINKLLERGHRVLTVAQFAALTGLEGTKGTVAPDEVYLEVDATNGILWHFVYESGEATYRWRFLGGPPMFSEVAAAEATTSAAYAALATAGPSLSLPRAGDYDIQHGARILIGGGGNAFMSYDIGATAAVDADGIANALQNSHPSVARFRRKTALTAVALTAKYRNDAAVSATFERRWMTVAPTRIRHDA